MTTKQPAPLWARIPFLFGYTARPASLGVIVLLSALVVLVSILPLGIFISLLITFIALRYFFDILATVAYGEQEPPGISYAFRGEDWGLPFKALLLVLIIIAAGKGLEEMGLAWLAVLLAVPVQIAIPAIVMLLGVSNSFTTAVNPANWFRLMNTLGMTYVVLLGLQFVLNTLSLSNASSLALETLGGRTLVFVLAAVFFYFYMLNFAMMGYAVYQHHEALGVDVAELDDDETEHSDDLNTISPLFKQFMDEGNYLAAIGELKALIADQPDNVELLRKMDKLTELTDQPEARHENGILLIETALQNRQPQVAVETYLGFLATNRNFRPSNADTYFPLFQALRSAGKAKQAVSLSNGFHQLSGADTNQIITLYFEVARTLSEDLSNDLKALQVLNFLSRKTQGRPEESKINDYIRILKTTYHGD